MIEDCCRKAGGDIEKYLFKAVTEGKSYAVLRLFLYFAKNSRVLMKRNNMLSRHKGSIRPLYYKQ